MTKTLSMIERTDDDIPKVPNPLDDCLTSAQSRRYWRQQEIEYQDANNIIRSAEAIPTSRNFGH